MFEHHVQVVHCMHANANEPTPRYVYTDGGRGGARVGCSGTIDNLLIDRMVSEDSTRGRRNLSMAWTDKKKAYDSVYHKWLVKMMSAHKFPEWGGKVARGLCSSWNTRIVAKTKEGSEMSEVIFNKGLPQGEAFLDLPQPGGVEAEIN